MAFLNGIPDDNLRNFPDQESTLYIDNDRGFRLDHQGVGCSVARMQEPTQHADLLIVFQLNTDPGEDPHIHRLYVQPVRNKSSSSKSQRNKKNRDTSSVTARCHASNEAEPQQVRDALLETYPGAATVGYAPPRG